MAGVFSMDMMRALMRDIPPAPATPFLSAFGMPVRTSSAFPFTTPCGKCGGNGEGGEETTYCRKCRGGGTLRYEGVILNGPTDITTIVSYSPKLFEPRFPFALPVRPIPNPSQDHSA